MMGILYKTYSVAQVRAWLYEGAQNGLSEHIITKTRANSIIHNPYVKDDMVIVVAAFDNDKVVGFTAMFPEHLIKPDIWISVGTTLYADSNYPNEFIGYNLVKMLHDASGSRYVVGSDVAPAAAVIDKLLGMSLTSFVRTRYVLKRDIRITSVRSLCGWLIEPFRLLLQKRYINKLNKIQKETCNTFVMDFFDKESYDFIVKHSNDCLFLRSHKMLNWIAKYPFRVESVQYNSSCNAFSDKCTCFKTYSFKVLYDKLFIGVFMIAVRGKDAHILLLYTEKNFKDVVYSEIFRFVNLLNVNQLYSVYDDFNTFIKNKRIALKSYTYKFLFTYPKEMSFDNMFIIQGADGDMFA